MAERVISVHEVHGTIPALAGDNMVGLIYQLGERQTEDNITAKGPQKRLNSATFGMEIYWPKLIF